MRFMSKTAIVVICTTGVPEIREACDSVDQQTYRNVSTLIVIDGPEFEGKTHAALGKNQSRNIVCLPFNTGSNGYYGHRIIAAFGHLIPADYILFLDHDNWYESDHVESLVDMCETRSLDWAYSLRNIVDKSGKFICRDNCESLGKWPVAFPGNGHLVDTSTYCFSNKFLRATCHIWDHPRGADRRYFSTVKDTMKHTNYDCSGKYTMNYRLGGNCESVTSRFFIEGNALSEKQYPTGFPWVKECE